jgi:hypothetical protein
MRSIAFPVFGLLLTVFAQPSYAADTMSIKFNNATSKTISQSGLQVCGGATCTAPSSISSSNFGTVNATATISLSTIQYRYGATFSLVTKTCRASLQLRTSNGTCELINVSMLAGDDAPSCVLNNQNVSGSPGNCVASIEVTMSE